MKINRPNFHINRTETTYNYLGDNNIMRTFSVILSSCYNDLTKQSRYYNKINDDKMSLYYVRQIGIESELKAFYDSPNDEDKYLIGFTGIGKTTLIKNHFGIVDANPFVNDDKCLIAYISVFSDSMNTVKDVKDVCVQYLYSIVEFLKNYGKVEFDLSKQSNLNIIRELIKKTKSRLLFPEDENLSNFRKKKTIEFYAIVIKYLLSEINKNDVKINKLLLIYDDIEARNKSVHIPFIENALNISSFLCEISNRNYIVKSLISLRNYTFRYHLARQAEAKRNDKNVILKETIPNMKDIFEKRFKVYYENTDVTELVGDKSRWEDAVSVLREVVGNIANFGDMITSLAHYDIATSLQLFLQILTNHRWFAPREQYNQGAYGKLDRGDYLSSSIKERVFKALVYGEGDVYVDSKFHVIRNCLSVHEGESSGVELMSLYVLEYMITLQRNTAVTLYGEARIKGCDLSSTLNNVLQLSDEKSKKMEYTIAKLYEQEYLLHSIFEAEMCDDKNKLDIERSYKAEYGLYLSLRGNKVLEMLENDSLLFEVLRDDIDTRLPDNDIPSARLSQFKKLKYLIAYCNHLFDIEKDYICNSDKEEYFRIFGGRFIISRLIIGVQNTCRYYYKSKDEESTFIKDELTKLYKKILEYKQILLGTHNTLHIDTKFIEDYLD